MTNIPGSAAARVHAVLALGLAAALCGCNPYTRFVGESNAGPVDPVTFPPEYLGTGGRRERPGAGVFRAIRAYADGAQVEYFRFSFTATQLGGSDPLLLRTNDTANARVPTPLAYVFDPSDSSPFPSPSRCKAPDSYTYDPITDDVRYDEQGNLFTALPVATYTAGAAPTSSYVPLVAQVPVTSGNQACQSIKSDKTLLASTSIQLPTTTTSAGLPIGQSDGKYVAWAVIDPGAAVYHAGTARDPETGLGLQKWGWYKRYLLAYIDGGYVPTVSSTSGSNTLTRIQTQTLYYPRSQVIGTTTTAPGALAAGYDVLEAARGQTGYSPVCAVRTYDTGGPMTVDQLPKDADIILSLYGGTIAAPTGSTPAYVYCLQAQ